MLRKLFFGFLTAAALTLQIPSQAARTVPVQVDGRALPATAYLESGVTYVPLRSLLEAFGGWTVSWDSQSQVAQATSQTQQITADPHENTLLVNGQHYQGEISIQNGRTYIPLRLLTSALGGSAKWDPWLSGAAVTSPGAPYDASDLYWLSRIISAESQGESQEGQIAVGNVVVNRVQSAEFPADIPSVIFDRQDAVQFTPVSNGTLYHPPTPQSVESAKKVLDGENTVGSALFFYAPSLSQGTWINANRTYLTTIGCHRFYL